MGDAILGDGEDSEVDEFAKVVWEGLDLVTRDVEDL